MNSYDQKQESKPIICLDANKWYSYAMSKFLPTSGLKWIDPKEFELNKHTRETLSAYQLKIADLYNIPIDNVKK